MGDSIPPKNTTKKDPEPELHLPETKLDVLKPSGDNPNATISLSEDAWEIFNVDNLPTISDEQMEKYNKHVVDRRQVWVKSKINQTVFPIRMRVLENEPKDNEEPEFKQNDEGDVTLTIKNFKYRPISIHQRQKIVVMTSELQDIQRTAQALAIVKSMEQSGGVADIKIDFKSLPEILQHEDFTTIQTKLMKKQIELNEYRFKAYLGMSKKDVMCAYWGDTRDWLDVCVEKETHVLDPQVGVM
jgi:hypothetical protein